MSSNAKQLLEWTKRPVKPVYHVQHQDPTPDNDAKEVAHAKSKNATTFPLPGFICRRLENSRNSFINFKDQQKANPRAGRDEKVNHEVRLTRARMQPCMVWEYATDQDDDAAGCRASSVLQRYVRFRQHVWHYYFDADSLRLVQYSAVETVREFWKGKASLMPGDATAFIDRQPHLQLIREEVQDAPWFAAQKFRHAAHNNDVDAMSTLLKQHGRNILSAPGKHGGKSAVFCAASNLSLDALSLMLDWDKHTNPDAPEHCHPHNGLTPLMAALRWRVSTASTTQHISPKQHARVDHQLKVVNLLLRRGANPCACVYADPKMKRNMIHAKMPGTSGPLFTREQQRLSALAVAVDATVHPVIMMALLDHCAAVQCHPRFALPVSRELNVAEKILCCENSESNPVFANNSLKRRDFLQQDRSSLWHMIVRRLALTNPSTSATESIPVLSPAVAGFCKLLMTQSSVAQQQKAYHDLQFLNRDFADVNSHSRHRGRRSTVPDTEVSFDASYTTAGTGGIQFAPLNVAASTADAKTFWDLSGAHSQPLHVTAHHVKTRQFANMLGYGPVLPTMSVRAQPSSFIL